MKIVLIFELITVLTFLFKNVMLHACDIKCRTKFYFARNGSVFAGHALNGFAYRNVTTVNPKACFHRCLMDYRCISFNYRATSSILNCQLNEENRKTKPQEQVATLEFDYYDLVIDYPPEGSNADVCSDYNNCGKSHPCLNGGQCVPNYDKNGKRFICHCLLKFTGSLCQTRRARDCVEVWNQGWRQSGRYVVLDQNENNLTVYCDLTSEPEFIWTLVESFSLEKVGQFRNLPSFKTDSIAIYEDNPDWSEYKMSHAHMQHVRARSTHWRATCNYPTRDIDYTDYLRTSFNYFDLLVDPVTSPKCQKFELINIRGISCMECTAGAYYGGRNRYTFHIDGQRSSSVNGCQFDGSTGAVSSEDNFGYYGKSNTAFSCTKSPISTTQIWFGRKK